MPRKISAKKIKDVCNIALDDLKAVDINAFDVEKTSSFASYILLATGTSNRHVKSLAEKVVDDLKDTFKTTIDNTSQLISNIVKTVEASVTDEEIKKETKNNKYAYEYYIDEYCSLIDLKAKIKKERDNANS